MAYRTGERERMEAAAAAQTLAERAQAVLPGGRVTQFSFPDGRIRVLARGLGSHVWDSDGVEYVDYVLGSGPLILGHAHPAVVEAVRRQAALGSTFYVPTEPAVALAERIVERVPCAELVQFCTSGSEATLYALRIARAATGRDAILKFEGGFHGANDYALMSLAPTGPPSYPSPEPLSDGIPKALEREVLVAPFNDLETTTAIVEGNASRLAGIIVEPFQRVIEPQPGFLEGLRALATRRGLVLVFDEVVTGFRFGPGGAQEYYGVTPDLATFAKTIGGGYPLAAVAGRRDLMELADHGRRGRETYAYISGTLNGNPIACAAGLATLDVLDEPGSYERLFAVGARLRGLLEGVFREMGVPAQVLGVGPIFQALLTGEPATDYRSMRRADAATMKRIAAEVLSRGIFLSGEKSYISLVHSDEDLERTAEAFAAAVAAVRD